MYKHVLFDLDGTLTDSKEGIIKSVAYALDKMGIDKTGKLEQHIVVGPPLMYTFTEVYGFLQEQAEQCYGYFQERYSTIGKFENRPFAGIIPMLKTLQERGMRSYVATSKPAVHARAIADKFGLTPYLSMISGSELGGTETKALMIKRVLDRIGPHSDQEVIMVGDRKYDVIGAREQGIPVILVAFGYSSEEERQECNADFVVPSVPALTDVLLNH